MRLHYLLLSAGTDDKDRIGLKLEKIGQGAFGVQPKTLSNDFSMAETLK